MGGDFILDGMDWDLGFSTDRGEREMTNKDIAEKITRSLVYAIERALDEAEKRGAYSVGNYIEEAFIKGQKKMRERAAIYCREEGYDMLERGVRSLPIDGGI